MINTFMFLDPDTTDPGGVSASGSPLAAIPGLVLGLVTLVGMWKVFSKAGQPGWACIIPIYREIVLCKIAGKPAWWFLLFFVCSPIVWIILSLEIAKRFGKGTGFAVGLIVLPYIFVPILGLGSSTYQGPAIQ